MHTHQASAPKANTRPQQGPEGKTMNKPTSDGAQTMREHGVYPLLDTSTNDALLLTIYTGGIPNPVSLYVDTKGYHLIWKKLKTDVRRTTCCSTRAISRCVT